MVVKVEQKNVRATVVPGGQTRTRCEEVPLTGRLSQPRRTSPSETVSWRSRTLLLRLSSRYERASMIVTSNKPFSAWGEIFGDDTVAVAMIDRLVHYADILSLKGDSYRLRDRDLGGRPPAREPETA